MEISVENLYTLLGQKEVENAVLRRQVQVLNQRIAELTNDAEPDEEVVDGPGV